ncbi:DUF4230 domain-containing protein [Catelliglobosispora koreensis]|uniref:DUF4230 domain-containing protein n=1 Tax=Catelliglobosispora koreensis TaxID=129052 RepID=UPI0003821A62|nr:DUF4230 domain-containing protein [Catelliglobosispora koreensis]
MSEPTQKMIEGPTQPIRTEKSRFGRRVFWTLLIIALIGAMLVGFNAGRFLPDWLKNPFQEQVTDQSQPPILLSIKDLARFVAAEGNFEVVIDLKKDRKYVPDWLINERTLFVAAGTVEAYVEFSNLTEDKIKQSEDRKSVEISLPAPVLAEPKLNLDRSYVFAEERGLFNRVGDFFDGDNNRQRETLLVANQRLATAAQNSQLIQRAQENTRKTLESLLRSLGFTSIIVTFDVG